MQTGDVEERFYPQNFENAKLTDIGKHLLLDWVIEKPGIYLRELKEELLQATGVDITESRICRYLKK